jgi:23S rRNA pseudouridine1911/1915/1917 synthase
MSVIDRSRSSESRNAGKEAITHYRIKERYHGYTRVQVKLETGRTHQIRVHMAFIHHPLVGDPVYGGRLKLPAGHNEALKQFLHDFRRQALHARKLGLTHPDSGRWVSWEVEPPKDMLQLTQLLQDYSREQAL